MSIASDIINLAVSELEKKTCKCDYCKRECVNNCKNCLEDIHMKDILRRYDCHFMRSYYLVSYLYKYKKEIRMAFVKNSDTLEKHLKFAGKFKIVSFGCGPATELIGFYEYMLKLSRRKDLSKMKIKYIGIDLNKDWEFYFNEVTSRVENGFNKIGVDFVSSFYRANALNFKLLSNEKIDIVIFPYLLSEMRRFAKSHEDMLNTIDYLWDNLKDKMRNQSIIVCNDINHNAKARDFFVSLASKIENLTLQRDSCFAQTKKFYHFGDVIEDNEIDNDFPKGIRGKYNVWGNCTSAQSIFFIG